MAEDCHPDDVPEDEMTVLELATWAGLTLEPWQRDVLMPFLRERRAAATGED